jgi:hypothetical protein
MNTSTPNTTPSGKPKFFIASVVAAALIIPLLFLISSTATSGGDGLQTFWPSVLAFAGCVLASLICMTAGFVRGERPRWLAIIAVVLCVAPLVFLGM